MLILRSRAILIFEHLYFAVSLSFFHSFVALFLLPLIFGHSYFPNLLPLIFAQARCAKIKGAQILMGIRYLLLTEQQLAWYPTEFKFPCKWLIDLEFATLICAKVLYWNSIWIGLVECTKSSHYLQWRPIDQQQCTYS